MLFIHKNNFSFIIKTFVNEKKHKMHEKFEFDLLIEGVRAEVEDEAIEVQSDDEEKSAKENHVIVID